MANDRDGKKTSGGLSQTGKRQLSAETILTEGAEDEGLPHTGGHLPVHEGSGVPAAVMWETSEPPNSWAASAELS